MRDALRRVPRRELILLGAAVALGLVVRFVLLYATRHHPLAGDETYYDIDAKLWANGHPFWSTSPLNTRPPHASMWKAPGYTAWLGVMYEILGSRYHRVEAVQILLIGPITITLMWALGRHLFNARVGAIAAFAAAVYPFLWQFELLLYPEALAVPLAAGLMLIVLKRTPTTKRAVAAGLVLGVSVLVRPTAAMFGAMIAVAWWTASGLKTGTKLTAISAACAILVVVPWTIRNHHVSGAWVPISIQDAASYGTFNDEAAHDPVFPWAWRPIPRGYMDVYYGKPQLTDLQVRRTLQKRARKYIREHPSSLIKAWFWNGITRTYDLRRPNRALSEVVFEGRSRALDWVGLFMYWIAAALALGATVMLRRRRELILPVIAVIAASTVVFTSDGGTRYRATIEPIIVVFACAAPGLWLARRKGVSPAPPGPS